MDQLCTAHWGWGGVGRAAVTAASATRSERPSAASAVVADQHSSALFSAQIRTDQTPPLMTESASSNCVRRVTSAADISRVQSYLLTQCPDAIKLWATIDSWQTQAAKGKSLDELVEPVNPQLYVSCSDSSSSSSSEASAPDSFSDLDVVVLVYGAGNISEEICARKQRMAELRAARAASGKTEPEPFPPRDLWVAFHARRGSDALLKRVLRETLPTQLPFMFTGAPGYFVDSVLTPLAQESAAVLDVHAHQQWIRRAGDAVPAAAIQSASPNAALAPAASPSALSSNSADAASCSMSPQPALQSASSLPAYPASSASSSTAPVVTVGPLRLCHVDLVRAFWPYSGSTTTRVLRWLIGETQMHRCVFVDGEPVCWALVQSYGGIGMLHTREAFRGQGYARLCVDSLCAAIFATGQPGRNEAFCFVGTGNRSSQSVFRQLGFSVTHDAHWIVWIPDVYPTVSP